MPKTAIRMSETLRRMRATRHAYASDRAAGRLAAAALYDRTSGLVILRLTNGCVFGFPARSVPAIADLTTDELRHVTVLPGGGGLEWKAQDRQLSVPGLLLSSIGRSERLSELARLAGSAKSHAKAAAARRNGRKGGRPPKTARRRK